MLKFATIGTSWITEQMIEAARLTQRYQLKAVYSRHSNTAKKIADTFQADYYTEELNNILYDPAIDLIYIASPNSLHYTQAKMAVAAGKHVIVEKPIVATTREWRELFTLADQKKVYIFEGAMHYHNRNYKRLRQLILKKIEETEYPLLGANFNFCQYSSRYDTYLEAKENKWPVPNVFNAEYQGGTLMDLGIYPLYIALDLFGMPKSVRYHAVDDGEQIDLFGTIILQYAKTQITIVISKAVYSQMPSEIYIGDETFIIKDISRITDAQLVNREGEVSQIIDYKPANPMYDELLNFAEIIENKDNIHNEVRYESWRQLSLQVTQTMELLRQSAKLF